MVAAGAVAEWLGRGLQSLVHQFDSGRRLFAYGFEGSGAARVIPRTDGVAIPAAQETTTSTAAVISTASVPNASDAGPASAWPTGLSPSATSHVNESTRESRWLGISR